MIIKLYDAVVKIDGLNIFITFLFPVLDAKLSARKVIKYLSDEAFIDKDKGVYQVYSKSPSFQ